MTYSTTMPCFAAAALVLSAAACSERKEPAAWSPSAESTPGRASTSPSGKPQAPVDVTATISGASATVTLSFAADATGVDVEVRGVDGLAVTSAAQPIAQRSYPAGASETLTVTLAPPAGQSNLVVTVRGTFGGVGGTKVASFTVGDRGAPPRKPDTTVKTPSGERIKELPAETR